MSTKITLKIRSIFGTDGIVYIILKCILTKYMRDMCVCRMYKSEILASEVEIICMKTLTEVCKYSKILRHTFFSDVYLFTEDNIYIYTATSCSKLSSILVRKLLLSLHLKLVARRTFSYLRQVHPNLWKARCKILWYLGFSLFR